MKDWIFGEGSTSAKLMIIGDFPDKNSEIQGRPFVGMAGDLLNDFLEVAKLSRSEVYVTNIVKIRPPDGDLNGLHTTHNPDTDKGYKVEDFLPLLYNEIDALKPNCILALGSLACKTLTGKDGIKSWRGSILECNNYKIKVIPTIHPTALFDRTYKGSGKDSGEGMFSWKQKSHIQFDFLKASYECQFPGFESIPNQFIELIRTSLQLEQFFNMYKDYRKVYVDVEVFKSHLVCIGFAFTPTHGCSIPLIHLQSNENYKGIALNELVELWKIVAEKLADPNLGKAGQNFKADKLYWLETAGFEVYPFVDDGMFKFHTLSPELPKSLAFQQSILTNIPFHKNEGKEYNPHKDNIDNLLHYNGMDCCSNCECIEAMDKDLKEFGLEEFYKFFVMDMYPIYEGIERRGWLIDKEKKKELSEFYADLLKKEEIKLDTLITSFNIILETKDGQLNYDSPQQVEKLLYTTLRIPQRKDTTDQTLTALCNNVIKDNRKKQIILGILACRSLGKLKEVYVDFDEDKDGRSRCTYNQVGTETGRTSTSIIKKPLRNGKWGVPLQTIPRPDEFGGRIREQFIADAGKILIECDQSQAEARLVALLAEDYDLLALYDITDVHKLTASFCYNYTSRGGQDLIKAALSGEKFDFLDQVTDPERQVGKSTRHGCAYDLGEEGLSIKMKISLYRAKESYRKVHEMSPKIKEVFQEGIQQALIDNRNILWTPFGRRREFFNKWGKELWREAYAHIPQSTIGDNTKRCMHNLIYREKVDWVEILQEGHDSFCSQIDPRRVRDYYQIVKPTFEEEINFDKCTIKRKPLVIPTDFKIGYSWGTLKKYKGQSFDSIEHLNSWLLEK